MLTGALFHFNYTGIIVTYGHILGSIYFNLKEATVAESHDFFFLFQNLFTTVTLWGTCGRYSGRNYHEWDGVVCLGQQTEANKEGKVNI